MSDLNYSLPLTRFDALPATIAGRTRRIYDLMAGVYPASTFFFHSKAHRRVLDDLGIRDGSRVLEVATGSGEMFGRLVQVNRKGATFGLDLSPNMAARTQRLARRGNPGVKAHCQAVDVRHMPFRDESFDAVVCCYLFELLSAEDIRLTLGEIRRVLRRDGKLGIVLIAQRNEMYNRLYQICGRIAPAFWGRQVEQQVPEILEATSLRIVSDRCVTQSFYPSRVLVTRK